MKGLNFSDTRNLNPSSANPEKGSNAFNVLVVANELFECVDHFVGLALKRLSQEISAFFLSKDLFTTQSSH